MTSEAFLETKRVRSSNIDEGIRNNSAPYFLAPAVHPPEVVGVFVALENVVKMFDAESTGAKFPAKSFESPRREIIVFHFFVEIEKQFFKCISRWPFLSILQMPIAIACTFACFSLNMFVCRYVCTYLC